MLEKVTSQQWERTPGSGAYATRTGDMRFAGDVMCTTKPNKFVWELKKYKEADLEDLLLKKGNMWKWFEQLVREKKHRPGILVFSKNYGKITVVAEANLKIPGTFMWDGWVIGLFDEVVPKLFQ